MPTIAHISDLHLQSGVPARQAQVEPILRKINAMKPDLVVISGDVTDDGWDSIEELKWAKGWLDERIDAEWFAVPGNHDVGNFASQSLGRISEQRVANWETVFGYNVGYTKGCTPTDRPRGLRVLGFNSMLFGATCKQQKLEHQWLKQISDVLIRTSSHVEWHVAVFIHTPLFIERPNETSHPDTDYWLGHQKPRRLFLESLIHLGVKLICSGHVHQTRLTEVDGIKIAWAPPASGTWVHAPGLPNPPMPAKTGFFLHTLHDDGRVESELIECAPMLKLIEFDPTA